MSGETQAVPIDPEIVAARAAFHAAIDAAVVAGLAYARQEALIAATQRTLRANLNPPVATRTDIAIATFAEAVMRSTTVAVGVKRFRRGMGMGRGVLDRVVRDIVAQAPTDG